jgi:hypothetical protein
MQVGLMASASIAGRHVLHTTNDHNFIFLKIHHSVNQSPQGTKLIKTNATKSQSFEPN